MKHNPLVGLRVEFLRDSPPVARGDCGKVVSVRYLPDGQEIVVVESQGKFVAAFKFEIRLVEDPTTATMRLSRAQDAAKQSPTMEGAAAPITAD